MRKLFIIIASFLVTQSASGFAIEENSILRAQAAFDAQLAFDCAQDRKPDWLSRDAVYEYALSGIDISLRVEGHEAIAAHLCALQSLAPHARAENIHYYPTLDPEITYVQFDLVPGDKDGGEGREVAAIIQMRGGQTVRFLQLSTSPETLEVLRTRGGR